MTSTIRHLDRAERDALLALARVRKAAEICEMGLCNEPKDFATITRAVRLLLVHLEHLRKELESVAPR